MKPLFGIDITQNKENEVCNGEEFIIRRTPKTMQANLEAKQKSVQETLERSKMPVWFRIIRNVCGYYGIMVAVVTIGSLYELSFSQMMKKVPLIIISGFFCLAVWAVMFYLSFKRSKSVTQSEDAVRLVESFEKEMNAAYTALNVPAEAVSADVLMFRYRVKEGEIKPHTVTLQTTPYINLDLKVFAEDGRICFADLENVHAVPLSALTRIRTVAKRISVPAWNKDVRPTDKAYKPYKLTRNQLGDVFLKSYHILEFSIDGQEWGIWFPCYELPTLEALTGLSAEPFEN